MSVWNLGSSGYLEFIVVSYFVNIAANVHAAFAQRYWTGAFSAGSQRHKKLISALQRAYPFTFSSFRHHYRFSLIDRLLCLWRDALSDCERTR